MERGWLVIFLILPFNSDRPMQQMSFYLSEFSSNKNVFIQLLSGLSEQQIAFKQSAEKWNLLEVICHLADEEKEDFRTRLKSVLEDPSKAFPAIDPVSWVKERNYASQDFASKLQAFINERDQSLQWLESLPHLDEDIWTNTYQHPVVGAMSAKFILANWLAHDYLHIRQIIKLKYDFLQQATGEQLSYAGNW
jgi:hypothetical protein